MPSTFSRTSPKKKDMKYFAIITMALALLQGIHAHPIACNFVDCVNYALDKVDAVPGSSEALDKADDKLKNAKIMMGRDGDVIATDRIRQAASAIEDALDEGGSTGRLNRAGKSTVTCSINLISELRNDFSSDLSGSERNAVRRYLRRAKRARNAKKWYESSQESLGAARVFKNAGIQFITPC